MRYILFLIRRVRTWQFSRKKGMALHSERLARRIFWYNNRLARKSFGSWWVDVFYEALKLESPLEDWNDE